MQTPTTTAAPGVGRIVLVAAALVGAFAIDRATKIWALDSLSDGSVIPFAPGFSLELHFNPGVAFGIGADVGAPLVIGLMLIISALCVWIALRLIRRSSLPGTVFLAVVAGGALGNLWDRISRAQNGPLTGEVIDFLAVEWFSIFNVADIFTTCGFIAWAMTSSPMSGIRATPAAPDRNTR
ncbi:MULTISPECIES: signal peptidase II [unclassified Rathayibacter]|uniref:signal peptidase II n=1 Tax=unclassified Rathayibacter TaxID=2609250 RepID=UPI0010486BBE|nr:MULTISPECIES: signal peptidase II [unclassified Rathayibacter]QHC68766.1 signal peptidase II [Rathayibacter sp. VKM Ac-2759]TCL77908.1 signal peptidase II [Rathayibacter sp. PhB192]TCM23748.1 signal peptidase II [Rathayibacter sp. PhB179]